MLNTVLNVSWGNGRCNLPPGATTSLSLFLYLPLIGHFMNCAETSTTIRFKMYCCSALNHSSFSVQGLLCFCLFVLWDPLNCSLFVSDVTQCIMTACPFQQLDGIFCNVKAKVYHMISWYFILYHNMTML